MGWRALFGRPKKRTFSTLHSPRGHEVEVHGESYHQPALSQIAGGRTHDGARHRCVAVVVPENGNKHDKNAIRVEIEGQQVGYVARSFAARYRSVLDLAADQGFLFTCDAVVVGGWVHGLFDKGMFGVWLELATPSKLRELLASAGEDDHPTVAL